MKVLILSENAYGCGASIAANRIGASLEKEKINIKFLHLKNNYGNKILVKDNKFAWKDAFPRFTTRFFILLFRILPRLKEKIELYIIENECKKFCPDILNIHNWNNTHQWLVKSKFRRNSNVKIVWTMHDEFALSGYNYTFRDTSGKLIRYGPGPSRYFTAAKQLIAEDRSIHLVSPSTWLARQAETVFRTSVSVINQPASKAFFPIDKTIARKLLGIDGDGFNILFLAGNGAPLRKGHKKFESEMCSLIDAGFGVLTIGNIFCNSIQDHPLWRMRRIKVDDTVLLNLIYNAADCFCIPSFVDNHPNTVVEALYTGTPILASNQGGVPEMIISGKNGILFDPYKTGSILSAAMKLRDETEILAKSEISKRAKIRFSQENLVTSYISIFDDLSKKKES